MSESVLNLANHFLIAMPQLEDEFFARSVVYVCEHNERGALGLVINKPGSLSFKALLEKIELPMGRADLADHPSFAAARCKPIGVLCCTIRWCSIPRMPKRRCTPRRSPFPAGWR